MHCTFAGVRCAQKYVVGDAHGTYSQPAGTQQKVESRQGGMQA